MSFAAPAWAVGIFLAQGAAMAADEWIFHRRRGLPRWERWGHPLDSLTLLACLGVALLFPPASSFAALYVGLAVFSCLFVTKDEWVHAQRCGPAEHWLHAVLFLLHPALLAATYLLWKSGEYAWLLRAEAMLCAAFLLYQVLYWNFPWRQKSNP
jgi:hypothetical protein